MRCQLVPVGSPTAAALVVNPGANDDHRLSTSPAIDTDTAAGVPSTDRDDNPRPSGKG